MGQSVTTFAEEELRGERMPEEEWETPGQPAPDLSWLSAPDIADLVKKPRSAKAAEYEKQVQSAAKVLARVRFQSGTPKGDADAAAIFAHGPAFARAAGSLADENEWAAKAIDILTAPDSPYLMFALSATTLIAQLARNHEGDMQKVRQFRTLRKSRPKTEKTRLTLHLGRFSIRIPVPFKIDLSGFIRSQSVDPEDLTLAVFSNSEVQKAIRKQGWQRMNRRPGDTQEGKT